MTTKEKAEDLIHQYRIMLMDYGDDYGEEILVSILSSRCALIAVDEILNALKHPPNFNRQVVNINTLEYWAEVKQEIENL